SPADHVAPGAVVQGRRRSVRAPHLPPRQDERRDRRNRGYHEERESPASPWTERASSRIADRRALCPSNPSTLSRPGGREDHEPRQEEEPTNYEQEYAGCLIEGLEALAVCGDEAAG